MGFLSKVWKGIKKTVKKIGKGIKKVFGKVMKGIGKLGIVGQIGMMFLMPYAMGALGSLFGTAGKLASWSTKLLGPNANFLQKALGKTLEMINVGGTWVKNAYTSVSTAISNGIDRVGNFFKTGEFKLSADRSSVFSADFKDSLDTLPTQSGIKADQLKAEQLKAQQLQAAQDARLKEGIDRALEKPTGQMVLKDGKYVYESNFKPGEINLDSLKISPENLTQKMNYGDTGDLLNKEAIVMGSRYATKQEVIDSLDLVARGDVWPLVTDVRDMSQAEELHALVEDAKVTGRAALLIK